MKVCRKCGEEIINGVNGCSMAGDICFKCKPWNMDKIIPATNWHNSADDLNILENLCLDMASGYEN